MRLRLFLTTLLIVFTLSFSLDRINVMVLGKGDLVDRLKVYFSKYYNLVDPEDERKALDLVKQCDLGLRRCGEALKNMNLKDVDFIVRVSDKDVRFIDLKTAERFGFSKIAPISRKSTWIAKYFEYFVLYFKLPVFEDKRSRKGSEYVLMDGNFRDVGIYVYDGTSKIVEIDAKGAAYARRLRPHVDVGGKLIYELKEKDLSIETDLGWDFQEFEDGQKFSIRVRLDEGGFLSVFDIYGENLDVVVNSEPVEGGEVYHLDFEAYKMEGIDIETLVVVLTEKPVEDLSLKKLRDLLERALGVSIIRFTVR